MRNESDAELAKKNIRSRVASDHGCAVCLRSRAITHACNLPSVTEEGAAARGKAEQLTDGLVVVTIPSFCPTPAEASKRNSHA
jgi:hypothetical protein